MALILRERHVRALLHMPDTIAVLEKAFSAQAHGTAINRPRSRLVLANGVLNILAAAAPTFGVLGYKSYTAFREGIRYVIMLFSSQDGQLLAIVEAAWLGAIRTGAASALATQYMARSDATIVGLIGAGKQAATQLMGVCAVRPVTAIYVYSRRPRECRLFCREMTRLLNINVKPVATAQQAIEMADILITATTAQEPVVHGKWLKAGCHINAIGSNWPHKRELDVAVLQRCALIATDSLEQAYNEAGDLIIPANDGLFDWNLVHELGEIITDEHLMRVLPDDITLYRGLGTALEDVTTAAHVYHLACQQGIGEEVDLLL